MDPGNDARRALLASLAHGKNRGEEGHTVDQDNDARSALLASLRGACVRGQDKPGLT